MLPVNATISAWMTTRVEAEKTMGMEGGDSDRRASPPPMPKRKEEGRENQQV
jgi:hypothetical protein